MATRREQAEYQREFLFVIENDEFTRAESPNVGLNADGPAMPGSGEDVLEKRRELIRQLDKFGI